MIRQYGVLAYDFGDDGEPCFLLITSRTTRRWIIPRGNPIRGLAPHKSAAQEGFEEAGLTGEVSPDRIGTYRYLKVRRNGSSVVAKVHVFPLRAAGQSRTFPESDQRDWAWFSRDAAAAAVDEEELKALIRGFVPPPD